MMLTSVHVTILMVSLWLEQYLALTIPMEKMRIGKCSQTCPKKKCLDYPEEEDSTTQNEYTLNTSTYTTGLQESATVEFSVTIASTEYSGISKSQSEADSGQTVVSTTGDTDVSKSQSVTNSEATAASITDESAVSKSQSKADSGQTEGSITGSSVVSRSQSEADSGVTEASTTADSVVSNSQSEADSGATEASSSDSEVSKSQSEADSGATEASTTDEAVVSKFQSEADAGETEASSSNSLVSKSQSEVNSGDTEASTTDDTVVSKSQSEVDSGTTEGSIAGDSFVSKSQTEANSGATEASVKVHSDVSKSQSEEDSGVTEGAITGASAISKSQSEVDSAATEALTTADSVISNSQSEADSGGTEASSSNSLVSNSQSEVDSGATEASTTDDAVVSKSQSEEDSGATEGSTTGDSVVSKSQSETESGTTEASSGDSFVSKSQSEADSGATEASVPGDSDVSKSQSDEDSGVTEAAITGASAISKSQSEVDSAATEASATADSVVSNSQSEADYGATEASSSDSVVSKSQSEADSEATETATDDAVVSMLQSEADSGATEASSDNSLVSKSQSEVDSGATDASSSNSFVSKSQSEVDSGATEASTTDDAIVSKSQSEATEGSITGDSVVSKSQSETESGTTEASSGDSFVSKSQSEADSGATEASVPGDSDVSKSQSEEDSGVTEAAITGASKSQSEVDTPATEASTTGDNAVSKSQSGEYSGVTLASTTGDSTFSKSQSKASSVATKASSTSDSVTSISPSEANSGATKAPSFYNTDISKTSSTTYSQVSNMVTSTDSEASKSSEGLNLGVTAASASSASTEFSSVDFRESLPSTSADYGVLNSSIDASSLGSQILTESSCLQWTSNSPENATSFQTSRSLNEEAIFTIRSMLNEISGLASDAESKQRNNSFAALSWQEREAMEINITFIIEFRLRIKRLLVDMKGLLWCDLVDINNVTIHIRYLRSKIQTETSILNEKSISEVRTIVTIGTRFLGGLSKAIEFESQRNDTYAYQLVLQGVQTTLISIKKNLALISFTTSIQNSNAQETMITIITIIRLKIIIFLNEVSKSVHGTRSTLTDLNTVSISLTNVFTQISVIHSSYQSQIEELTILVQTANTEVKKAIQENIRREATYNKMVILSDLQSATGIVKESITYILKAQKKSEGFTNTIMFEIPQTITDAYDSVQASLASRSSINQWDVNIIKSFESEAFTIIQLMISNKVIVKGLESVIIANREMQRTVAHTIADISSRSYIYQKVEILTSVSYYISYIIEIVINIKNKTTATEPPQNFSIISAANSYLLSLNINKLTKENAAQLQTFSSQMMLFLESMENNTNIVTGIDLLLVTANATIPTLNDLLVKEKANKEVVTVLERTEVVFNMLYSVQLHITTLLSKMSFTATQTSAKTIRRLESAIWTLEILILRFTENSYEILEEDVVNFQSLLTIFDTLVSEINSFTEIKGLTRFEFTVQNAITVTKKKEQSLLTLFETKMQLETFDYMNVLLADIQVFFSTLKETSSFLSTSYSASLIIIEIHRELELWSNGVEYIQRSAIDDLKGLFISLQSLLSSGQEVSGKDALMVIVVNLQSNITNAVATARAAEFESELRFNTEVALHLVFDVLITLQKLTGLTETAVGTAQSYTQVFEINYILTRLSRREEITLEFIDEFRSALSALTLFVNEIKAGKSVTKILNLEQVISVTQSVKKSIQTNLKHEEESSLEIFTAVNKIISTAIVSLENSFINESAVNVSQVETVNVESIDDFYGYLLMIQEQWVTINMDFFELLQIVVIDIQKLISSTNKYTVIMGYQYSVTETILFATEIKITLTSMIEIERKSETESAVFFQTQNLFTEIKEIANTLQLISNIEIQSNVSYQQDFQSLRIILSEISISVSTFSSFSNVTYLLYVLRTIRDSNSKPVGSDSLLLEVESALETVETYVTQLLTSAKIKQFTATSQVTRNMIKELNTIISNLQPQQLVGDNNEKIEEFILYLISLSSNMNTMAEDVLTYITDQFNHLIITITKVLEDGQRIGNLIALRSAVIKVMTSSENCKREQMDRSRVTQEVMHVEIALQLLMQIQQELSNITNIITSVNITETDTNIYEEITNLSSIMKIIVQHSISKVGINELNTSLSTIQNLKVTAGTEIAGLFELSSLTEQSIASVTSEEQFLMSTLQSRKTIDILSSSTEILFEIGSLFENMLIQAQAAEIGKMSSTSTLFENLFYLLLKITNKEILSYSFIEDLEFLLQDLRSLSSETSMSAEVLLEALETTRTATFIATQTLSEAKRVSQERQQIILLERASSVISKSEMVLLYVHKLVNINGTKVTDENVTALLSFIQEMSETEEMDAEMVLSLESLTDRVEGVALSVISGKNIVGLEAAIDTVVSIEKSVTNKLTSVSKSIKRSAKRSVQTQAIAVMQQITITVTRLISSMTFVTIEDDPIVEQILLILEGITVESLTIQQVNVLTEKASALEAIKLQSGIGIAKLRELKSVTIARIAAIENSDKIFSSINDVSDSKKLYIEMESVLTTLKRELQNITISINTNETQTIISRLLTMSSIDITDLTETQVNQFKVLVESFRMVKLTIQVDSATIETLLSTISSSEREIAVKMRNLEAKSSKLLQAQTFLEVQTLLKETAELSRQIVQISGGEMVSSEENETVIRFITLFLRFRYSIVSISEADIAVIRGGIIELKRILRKQSSVKGAQKLFELSMSIVSSLSRETEMLEVEAKREKRLSLYRKEERAVSYVQSVLTSIATKTGEFTSSTEIRREINVFEIQQIILILILIQQGKATESDVEQLHLYTQTLETAHIYYTSQIKILGLGNAIKTVESLKRSLESSVIENSFDVSYSESVYMQKQVKLILLEISTELESLMIKQGNGTSGSFTNTVLNEIVHSIGRLESRTYDYSYEILQSQLATLKSVTAELSSNTEVTGISTAHRKTQYAVVTMKSVISRSYTIEYATLEVAHLNEAKVLFSRFEFILEKISKTNFSSDSNDESSTIEAEMTEIRSFLQNVKVYTAKELAMLREYVDLFFIIYRNFGNKRVINISYLIRLVTEQSKFVAIKLCARSRTQRTEKQHLVTGVANVAVQRAYKEVATIKKNYVLEEVKEIREVTQFSLFLRSFDMSSITPVGISRIEIEMEKFLKSMADNTHIQSIAYLSSISEQLLQFTFASERQLKLKQTFENDQQVLTVLRESETVMKSTSRKLNSLRKRVSAAEIAGYEENPIITELYYFLIEYTFDYRLITEEFTEKLKRINYTGIEISGVGIHYLDEVLSLTDQFTRAEEQASGNVKVITTVLTARELQSSVSTFSKAIEQFLNENEKSNIVEDNNNQQSDTTQVYNESTPGYATNAMNLTEIDSSTEGKSLFTASSYFAHTSAGRTITDHEFFSSAGIGTEFLVETTAPVTETPDDLEFVEEIDLEQVFIRIQYNIDMMSSETLDFNGEYVLQTTELIILLMESDFQKVFLIIGKIKLQMLLYQLNTISVKITSLTESLESDVQLQNSIILMDETVTILKSIESSYKKIVTLKQGSSMTFSIISSIVIILRLFTNVYFISSEDVALLRSYSYQLSVASKSTDSIELREDELSSLMLSTLTIVESSSVTQSSLATVSKLSSTTTKSSSTSFSFSSYKSEQESTISEVTYSEEELSTIKKISRVSQQVHILKQFNDLSFESMESLQDLYNSTISKVNATTVTSSGSSENSSSTAVSSDDADNEENESQVIFSEILQILRMSVTNIHCLQYDIFLSFASYLKRIKTLMTTEEVIYISMLLETISYTKTVTYTFSEIIASFSAYATENQVFLNHQEATYSLQKLADLFSDFESSTPSASGATVIDYETSKHVQSITNFIIQYSMRGSTISAESLRVFKESFRYITYLVSTKKVYIGEYQLWKSFLIDSRKSALIGVSQSVSRGSITRSQTQGNLLKYTRTITLIDHYIEIVNNFTAVLTGTKESNSESQGRLIKIIRDFSQVSKQWSLGFIENYQINTFERYLSELSELLIILAGSQLPREINTLLIVLIDTRESIAAGLSRTEVEALQDRDDAIIDAKYDYYSQMSYFFESVLSKGDGIPSVNESSLETTTKEESNTSTEIRSTPFYNTTELTLDSLQNHTDDDEVPEITYLLQLFDRASSNPLLISIEDIDAYFTSLVIIIQTRPYVVHYKYFRKLYIAIQDTFAFVQVSLQTQAFERAGSVASSLSHIIMSDVGYNMHLSGSMMYVDEISDLYIELQVMKTQLYTISRSAIRKLQMSVYTLHHTIKIYGSNLVYLRKIDEYLASVQAYAKTYAKYTLKQYMDKRAIMIFEEASADIYDAAASLKCLTMMSDSESVTEYVTDPVINSAFYFFVNLTSDLRQFPRNLGSIIRDFNFGSVKIMEGYGITYLREVYDMILKLEATKKQVKTVFSHLDAAETTTRFKIVITNIKEKLKEFATKMQEEEEMHHFTSSVPKDFPTSIANAFNGHTQHFISSVSQDFVTSSTSEFSENTHSFVSSVSQDFVTSSTSALSENTQNFLSSVSQDFATSSTSDFTASPTTHSENVSQSTASVLEEETPMTLDEVMESILNISDRLHINGFVIEKNMWDEMEFYSAIVLSLTSKEGQTIFNLHNIIYNLSNLITTLSSLAHAHESAAQIELSYSKIKDVRELNKFILNSLTKVTSHYGTTDLIVNLVDIYEYFTKGYTLITQDYIASCWQFAFELSYSTLIGAPVDTSKLVSLISIVEKNAIEIEGFLSAHSYHYEFTFAMMKQECQTTQYMRNFDLSSTSQSSYVLMELDGVLSRLILTLSKFSDSGTTNHSSSILTEILSEVSSTVKNVQANFENIQFETLYHLSTVTEYLETLTENASSIDDTIIQNFLYFLETERLLINAREQTLRSYGRTSTQVLILQDAIQVVNEVTSEAKKWIYEDDTNCTISCINNTGVTTPTPTKRNCSKYSVKTTNYTSDTINNTVITTAPIGSLDNSTESSVKVNDYTSTTINETGATTSPITSIYNSSEYTARSADTMSIATSQFPFTFQYEATSSEEPVLFNISEEIKIRSFQDTFEQVSDIFMYWAFDSDAIDGESVIHLKYFMKRVAESCHVVKTLHMLDQALIDNNITLSFLLEKTLLKNAMEKANMEDKLLKYGHAVETLNTYRAITGVGDIEVDNTTFASEDTSSFSSLNVFMNSTFIRGTTPLLDNESLSSTNESDENDITMSSIEDTYSLSTQNVFTNYNATSSRGTTLSSDNASLSSTNEGGGNDITMSSTEDTYSFSSLNRSTNYHFTSIRDTTPSLDAESHSLANESEFDTTRATTESTGYLSSTDVYINFQATYTKITTTSLEEESRSNDSEPVSINAVAKIRYLIARSRLIIDKWSLTLDISILEILELDLYNSEMLELVSAGLTVEDISNEMRKSILETQSYAQNALQKMDLYSEEITLYHKQLLHISFFEQLDQLVDYSIRLLYLGVNDYEPGKNTENYDYTTANSASSDAENTSSVSSLSNASTVSNYTQSSINWNLDDGRCPYDDLLCAAMELLKALQQLSFSSSSSDSSSNNSSESNNSSDSTSGYSRESSNSTDGTSGYSSDSNNSTESNLSNNSLLAHNSESTNGTESTLANYNESANSIDSILANYNESTLTESSDKSFQTPSTIASNVTVEASDYTNYENEREMVWQTAKTESYISDGFAYQDVRDKVYTFSRAIRKFTFKTSVDMIAVLKELTAAQTIIREKIEKLEHQNMEPSVNVSLYVH